MKKQCSRCGEYKDLSSFHRDLTKKDGYKIICKDCRKKNKQKYALTEARKNLDKCVNASIYRSIRKNKEGFIWERLVGYTLVDLKKHLEEQFDDGMSWDNFGSYWWIDKIIPRCAFNYSNVNNQEFKKCWSLKNMRPLYHIECRKKGNRILQELVDKHQLYDILPIGLIIFGKGMRVFKKKEIKQKKTAYGTDKLTEFLIQFVDKLENKKTLDEKLYRKVLKNSVVWNKEAVLEDMIKQIEIFDDYNEEEVNFNYKPYIDKLSQIGLEG